MAEKKRAYSLITISHLEVISHSGISFNCRYDLVGFSKDGSPQYKCIYIFDESSGYLRENILIAEKISKNGPKERLFKLWPALIKHHHEYGDGTDIVIHNNFTITTGCHVGRNDVPSERNSDD